MNFVSEYKVRIFYYDSEVTFFIHQTRMNAERAPAREASATTLWAVSDVTVQLALIFLQMVSPALVLSDLTPGLLIMLHTIFFSQSIKIIYAYIFYSLV